VLIGGMILFLSGTLICALAGDLATMLVGRAIQAIGASSSLVAGRAMATDTAPVGRAAAPLAILTSVTLISPAVAPALGGAVTGIGGWRALFWILAGLTLIAAALAVRMLPETRPGDRAPVHLRRIATTYWQVLRQRGYLPLALSNALISGGFFTFLAASPFVLDAAGATPAQAGLFYSAVASAIIGGTLCVPIVLRRWSRALKPAGSVALGSGALAILIVAASGAGLVGLFVAMSLMAFGAGLTGPALLAEAIEQQRERASAATGLFGTMQMGGAALISTLVVRLAPSAAVELGLVGVLVLVALGLRLWGSRRLD
jgi:DHA1 family bicyclomycin/chloramphenicol resistance-like MFS transporter